MSAAEKLQDLVHRLAEDSASLVRTEIELVKTELREKAQVFAKGAVFVGIAAVFMIFAIFALIQAAIYGLGESLPLWASGLIVGGVLILVAAIAGLLGLKALKRGAKPVPEQAVAEAQAAVEQLRGARA